MFLKSSVGSYNVTWGLSRSLLIAFGLLLQVDNLQIRAGSHYKSSFWHLTIHHWNSHKSIIYGGFFYYIAVSSYKNQGISFQHFIKDLWLQKKSCIIELKKMGFCTCISTLRTWPVKKETNKDQNDFINRAVVSQLKYLNIVDKINLNRSKCHAIE